MDTFKIPLGLSEVKIEKVEITQTVDFIITVGSIVEEITYHKCGQRITKFHGHDKAITLRHLSILGKQTFIRIIPKRYHCFSCENHPTTTQSLSWYNSKRRETIADEAQLLLSLINSTVSEVSLKENIGYETITGVIDRYLGIEVNGEEIKRLNIIGLDEISLKKGHQDCVTIGTGRLGKRIIILAVLENRHEEKILSKLFQYSPLLKLTYELCWEMTDLFEEKISKSEAKRKIKRWRKKIEKSHLDCFDSFLMTLDNRIEEITNDFHDRYTSGFVEGLNNKIKVIKRRCYGVLNTNHLLQRIYLDLEGYSVFT